LSLFEEEEVSAIFRTELENRSGRASAGLCLCGRKSGCRLRDLWRHEERCAEEDDGK